MNIVEPIFSQARNKPSDLALAAPGTPLPLVSYARLVAMISAECRRLEVSGVRAGDRIALRVSDPPLAAIFALALTRLGAIVLSSAVEGYNWPFAVTVLLDNSASTPSTERHILVGYDWVATDGEGQRYERTPSNQPCCVFAEPDRGSSGDTRYFALTHELLNARIQLQDVFLGGTICAASRLFISHECTTLLGFQVLVSTLSRGATLFLAGDQTESFIAFETFQVEAAIVTPQVLLALTEFCETKVDSQCGLKAIFVVGQASNATLERASKILGAKISVGYYLAQPGMIASMPSGFAKHADNAVGMLLPGVTVEVEEDAGSQGGAAKVRFRSELAMETYGVDDGRRSDGGNAEFATEQMGYLIENGVLVLEPKQS